MSDTLEFFKAVLPNEGRYFLVDLFDGRQAPRHILMPDLETFAQKVIVADTAPGSAIYHACASYMKSSVQVPDDKNPGKTKTKYRVAENLGRMKSFWIDVDCGQEKFDKGDGYLKKSDAVQVIDAFAASVGLTPPMVVDSGNGMHFYWPLTISIGPKSWVSIATQLKNILITRDIKQDRTRTADAASILRPPGTHNRKDPANPKPVRMRRWAEETSPEAFLECMKTAGGPPPNTPNSVSTSALDSALVDAVLGRAPSFVLGATESTNALADHHEARHEHLPSSIERVAEHCQQVRHMRDTKGDCDRETWRGIIGIITHCVEGKVAARDWTEHRGDTGHEDTDWEKRYDTWNAGPTKCEFFIKTNPAGCEGCKFRNTDGTPVKTSPIMLGAMLPEVETVAKLVEVEAEDGTALIVEIPPKPANFRYEPDGLWKAVVDKDGIPSDVFLTTSHFYVYHWTKDADGAAFHALARLHQPRGGIVEWAIPMAATASPGEMMKALTTMSIMPGDSPVAAKHLTAYVKESINRIKSEVDEMNTMQEFGWRGDESGFLLGDKLHHVDGSTRKMILGGMAASKAKMFPKLRGTLRGYSDAVNFVYSRVGMEPLQYAFCNAFGSTLTPFSGEMLYNGVLFAITGGRTARGKTTVATAALYAFGDASQMTHAKTTTINARYAYMGAHGNIPMLFDEFTDIEAKELSAWAYSTSEGRDKGRMAMTGNKLGLADTAQWKLSPYVTANTDLRARLAEHRDNTQAESVRLIQIHIDQYALPQLNENDVSHSLEIMARNLGHAGEAFIKHVTANLPAVQADLSALAQQVSLLLPGTAYRNYRAHTVCTLGAAKIMIYLGIVDFNYEALFKFAIKLMQDMCREVEATSMVDQSSALANMVNGLQKQILSTSGFELARNGAPVEVRMHEEILGRHVVGNQATDKRHHGVLYLSRKGLSKWAIDHRTSLSEILAAARASAALIDEDVKINLVTGTDQVGAPIPCVSFVCANLGIDAQLPSLSIASTVEEATGT